MRKVEKIERTERQGEAQSHERVAAAQNQAVYDLLEQQRCIHEANSAGRSARSAAPHPGAAEV